jgi:hypothetical protein
VIAYDYDGVRIRVRLLTPGELVAAPLHRFVRMIDARVGPGALPRVALNRLHVAYTLENECAVVCGVVSGGFSTSYAWWVLGGGRVLALPDTTDETPKIVDMSEDRSMCLRVGAAQRLAAVHADGAVVTLDVTDRAPERRALSPDGTCLCTAERAGRVREWDTRTGQELASRTYTAPVHRVWWDGNAFDVTLYARAQRPRGALRGV